MYSGTGIYTLREASRLIDVSSEKIHRWLYGYNYSKKSGEEKVQAFSKPLWEPQLSKTEYEAEVIGFNDLLEIRFVSAFVKHGVDFTRFCRQTSTSKLKLFKRKRAQLVKMTVPSDSIIETLNVIKHV